MARRMHATVKFSYLVEDEEYYACPTVGSMAVADAEMMRADPSEVTGFLERADVIDIDVVPVVRLVTLDA